MEANFKKLLIVMALVLTMVPFLSATTTIDSPIANGNYSTTVNVTVTTDLANTMNITCGYNASGGAVGTYDWLTITNTSAGQTLFSNSAVSISALTDATTYNVSCQATNQTNSVEAAAGVSGITFDSTNPTCTLDIAHKNFAWKGLQGITWSSSDALSLVSTTVTIDGPEEYTTTSYSTATGDIQLTSVDTAYVGDWTVNITNTDRAGNSCTTITKNFATYLPDGNQQEQQPEDKDNKSWLLILVLAIVAIIAFGRKK